MPIFEQLEPRILFSADLIPLPVDTQSTLDVEPVVEFVQAPQDFSDTPNIAPPVISDLQGSDNNGQIDGQIDQVDDHNIGDELNQTPPPSEMSEDSTEPQELIFINDDIAGLQELQESLEEQNDSEVIILDSSVDGFTQIATALESTDDLQAVHFFTHGNDNSFKVGSSWINSSTLEENQDTVGAWGEHLSSEGDILFYGCDLAASSDGTDLLQEISDLTGADVAASDDTTGHQAMGGDWILEYSSGKIETEVVVNPTLQNEWLHILAEETIADNFETVSYSNNDGSVNWGGDWVEIGESDGAGAGNVLIDGDRLHLITADDADPERGISRMADLSGATSAYLRFDVDDLWWGNVSIEIRKDSGDSWDVLKEHSITPLSPAQQMRFDISSHLSATTEIRFVSTGTDFGGDSGFRGDFFVDNLHIDYTTDSWSMPLWLSTEGTVNNGGQTGVDSWDKADIIGLNNSSPLLGQQTDGDFSMAAQLSTFAEGADINGLHYVTTNMLIGSSQFELRKGDLLFTSENPDQKSFGNLHASRDDIIHFRPGASGDYNSGTFQILFDEVLKDKKIRGITLVESDVTVGDRDLHAGDLLFLRDGGAEDSDVYHYATVDVEPGSGTTSGTVTVLLEGDDSGIDISKQLTGIDLVEHSLTIGSTDLAEGTILLSVKDNDTINGIDVEKHDIFALDVTSTSSSDGSTDDLGVASASILFDGTDVDFDENTEKIDAFSLTIPREIPEPTFTGVSFNADNKTITLTGANLDYIGDIGENVKDRLDWSKITWDVNNDGATTPDISFITNNVSTVVTSPTTLTIKLTGQKTNEITGTADYGEDGGIDTMTILPGFVSNAEGEAATTDGLVDAPIATTTAPVGVILSNSSVPENTNTTGGYTVATLSTTDADTSDTHTYTITGGIDSGLFTIGGSSDNELILNAGLLDHETKPSYLVEITVTDSSGQTDSQLQTILVNDINETPIITANNLTILEDQTVTLTSTNLAATDEETVDGNLVFTVESVVGGQFENSDTSGAAITSFSQADVAAGKIIFIDDGDESGPSYSISVNDTILDSTTSNAAITFTNVNDTPIITTNDLTISEGQRQTLTTGDLIISDVDNSADELIFSVNSTTAGQFELSTAMGTAITHFSQEELGLGVVQFVHNGGEIAPAYTLTLSDGESSTGPSDAVVTFSQVNDDPVIQRNSLDILQGQTVLITDVQLLATDPDDAATALTYTISNPVIAGKFITTGDISETAINSFTQDDIDNGLVSFVHDNSTTAPSYDIEVKDDDDASSGIDSVSVNFNTVNQAPVFDTNSLTIAEGESHTLSDANFSTTDLDHGPESLIYTVSGVNQGQFESTDNLGVAVTSFTQADINAGKIIFKHDGGETGPSYSATVSDGSLSDSLASNITFNNVNDAPEIGYNSLTINEGATVAITPAILSATDIDNADISLTFTVSSVTGGIFTTTTDTATSITSFTQTQITAGTIQFIHNGGEAAPSYMVQVTDTAGMSSTTQAANVAFTGVNDSPQLTQNSLTISEGGAVTISASNLSAMDAETSSANLTFNVSSISGGKFERTSLPGSAITSFSQAEILAGEILFIHNGDEAAPAYQISVTDDDASPLATSPMDATISFTPVNDVPDLTVNTITLSEGETVTFDDNMLAATDSDSSEPNLIFSVTDLVAGTFINNGDPTTPITTFTQDQITNGEIQLVHDGGETALSYSISVSDGGLTTTASPATINFTAVNDAPTINLLASDDSYTEDSTQLISDISIADSDSGSTYQVTLDISDIAAGTLSTTDAGTATSTFAGSTLTISGSDMNDINSTLAATTFSPATDYTEDFTITISATDGLDSAAATTKSLHPIPVNDAPSASPLNQSGTYTEDVEYDLDDIVVADNDPGEILTATLTLDLPDKGALSDAGGANFDASTGQWSITGTAAEVNNALSLVTFTPTADSFVDVSIAVQVEDGMEDSVAPLTGTIDLTGNTVPDAPVVSSVGTFSSTPSEPIYITASSADGPEVRYFQITEIMHGELHLIDGATQVSEGDFITTADGVAGLIFTPDSDSPGSFKVKGSEDGLGVATESPSTTSTVAITVPEVVSLVTTPEPEGGGPSGTGGETPGETIIGIEEIDIAEPGGVDETLDLFAGQGDIPDDATTPDTDTSSTGKEESGDRGDESGADAGGDGEEVIDDSTSYINATKISQHTSANPGVAIAAAFNNLSFDFSFGSPDVNSTPSGQSQSIQNNSISLTAEPEDSPVFTTSNYDLLDLEYRDRSFEEYQSVRKSLENFREQTEQEASIEKTVVGSAIAASTGLSAGYVIWLLRSGALLSSILSSLPAWQLADPLAVLAGTKEEDEEDDDSIESIIEKGVSRSSQELNKHPQQAANAEYDR